MKFSTGSQNLACFSNRKPHDHVVRPRWHHSVVMVNVLPSTSVCVTSTSQAPKDITTGKPCRQFHFPCLSWNWRNDGYIMDTKCTRKRLEPHECPRCITKGSYTITQVVLPSMVIFENKRQNQHQYKQFGGSTDSLSRVGTWLI